MSEPLLKKMMKEHSVIVSPVEPRGNIGKVWIKTGKNKFDKRNLEIVSHWNTEYTVDSNKKITVTVPNVVQAVAYIKTSNFIIPKGQHTFSAKIEGEYSLMKLISVSDTSVSIIETATNTFTVNLAEDTQVFLYIYIDPTSTSNRMTIENIQIEKGNTVTDYEEYIEKEIYVKNDNSVWEKFYKEENIESGTITYLNDFSNSGWRPNVVDKCGKLVNLHLCIVSPTSFTENNKQLLAASIPVKYAPKTTIIGQTILDGGSGFGQYFIYPDGNIVVNFEKAGQQVLSLDISYFTN